MATPSWFNYEFYMGAKLAQMQKAEPEGNWTVSKLVDAFAQNGFMGEDGAYDHFVQYGAAEEVAPNADFNASEYYAAKAAQFYGVEPSAVTELQIANVKALINNAGMNAWTHYVQYGSNEGVNPSNAFDADAYLAAKAAAMGGDWTADSIAKAISDAGMTVLEHYLTYGGKGEGEVAEGATFPVADDQKVPSDATGNTYTLTVNADTVVGTSADDVINAPLRTGDGVQGAFTLSVGDNIDGGAGTDTLNVWGGDFKGVTMKNVEIVNHQVAGALDVSAYADVKEVWQNAAANTNTTTAQLTTKVGFGGTSTGAQNVTFTKADGTADAATVALNGVNMTSVTVASTDTANKIEAQNLDLSGKNVLTTLTNGAMTSLTITGDGSLAQTSDGKAAVAVGTGTGLLKSVDASAATGDLNLSFTQAQLDAKAFAYTGSKGADAIAFDAALTQKATIDLGTGDDTLTLVGAPTGTGSTFNGGEGNDTLAFNFAMTAAAGKMFSGFENVKLDANATYSVGMIEGVTGYELAGAASITKLADKSAVTVSADAATATLSLSDAAIANAGNSLTVLFDNGKDAAAAGVNIEALTTNAEVLNLESNGKVTAAADHNALTLAAANATVKNINITGDQAFDLTTGATTALTKIDGHAATGKLTINAATATQDMTIIGGSADDTITASAAATSTITGGAGSDTILLGTSAAGNAGDVIKLTAQSDSTATAFDHVTNFSVAAGELDKLDLTAFKFADSLQKVATSTNAKVAGADDADTASFTISAAQASGFFKVGGTQNGVVVVLDSTTQANGAFVFIDADQDGNWNADADAVIHLIGDYTAGITAANIDFGA